MKNNLLYLFILLSLCGCKQEITCPDTYDPATMEFRKFVMSLDGKYKFKKLLINGKDSSLYLDSLRIKNQILSTNDYDAPILTQYSSCNRIAYFFANPKNENIININVNESREYVFRIASKQNNPGILVTDLYGFNYKNEIPGQPAKITYIRVPYFNSAEYNIYKVDDTLLFTKKQQNREIKLLLF